MKSIQPMFLDLLRYVPYIKEENMKVQRLISGFSLDFNDQIDYNGPLMLKKIIGKLKHCYENFKCN